MITVVTLKASTVGMGDTSACSAVPPCARSALQGVAADVASLAAYNADSAVARAVSTAITDCVDAMGLTDPVSPNLCAEHCKSGQQSDHTASIVVPIAWPVVLYGIRPLPPAEPRRRSEAACWSALVAAATPHALLHCVRRS